MGAEDTEYLRDHTLGWDAFRERILEFPPDRVAAITGLPEERIVALGQRLATTRPTGIRCTMGMQRHAGGGAALRLLYALPGVTGDWKYPGGGASYSTSGRFKANVEGIFRDDLLAQPVRTLSMTRLSEGLLELDDPPVKALVDLRREPDEQRTRTRSQVRRGLEREDLFTVVMEQFHTDTVEYADIVLPATMQTEHLDVNDGYGHMYVHLNRPAVAPAGEALASHRDVPANRTRHGPDRAVALRRRRDARAYGARRRGLRAPVGGGLDAARLPAAVHPVHRRVPDALGPARVLLRERRRPTATTRSPATRRPRSRSTAAASSR